MKAVPLMLSIIALAALLLIVYLSYLEMGIYGHVINPSTAQLSFSNETVIMAVNNILNLTVLGKYEEAVLGVKLLNSTKIVKTTSLGQALNYINNVNNELMTLNQYVVLAKSLMEGGNYTGAQEVALRGLEMVPMVYNDIVNLIGILNSISSSLASTYSNELIGELNNYESELMNIVSARLTKTEITVSVNSTRTYVGGQIMVYGLLTAINGTPIDNATVILMINGQTVSKAITNSSGYYSALIKVPYIYTNSAVLTAIYNPPLSSSYLPSNASVVITILFNKTTLTVFSNNTVYWGSMLLIEGFASGPPGRVIEAVLGNYNVTTVTNSTGQFNIAINTTELTPGTYPLVINVLPNATYSPATYSMNVSITGFIRTLNVTSPNIVMTGIPTNLLISTRPFMGNESVVIVVGGYVMRKVLTNESTALMFSIPFTVLTGYHDVTIILPQEPPFMEVMSHVRVFVVNIIQIATLLLMAIAMVFLIKGHRSLRLVQGQAGEVPLGLKKLEIESRLIKLTPPKRLSNPNVMEVLKHTASAIAYISRETGIEFNETYTFREYLDIVSKKLGSERFTALAELLLITEAALYSKELPKVQDVERVKQLALVIAHEV